MGSVTKRLRKKSDQETVEKAYRLIIETIQNNPQIEPTLWASACWTAIVQGYINSGITFKEFSEDFERAIDHYKMVWEINESDEINYP